MESAIKEARCKAFEASRSLSHSTLDDWIMTDCVLTAQHLPPLLLIGQTKASTWISLSSDTRALGQSSVASNLIVKSCLLQSKRSVLGHKHVIMFEIIIAYCRRCSRVAPRRSKTVLSPYDCSFRGRRLVGGGSPNCSVENRTRNKRVRRRNEFRKRITTSKSLWPSRVIQ